MLSYGRGDTYMPPVSESQKKARNTYDKKHYQYKTIKMRIGDPDKLIQATKDKGHDSINDMILAALEAYTGLEGLRLDKK
jgi:acid phosphatase class B